MSATCVTHVGAFWNTWSTQKSFWRLFFSFLKKEKNQMVTIYNDPLNISPQTAAILKQFSSLLIYNGPDRFS